MKVSTEASANAMRGCSRVRQLFRIILSWDKKLAFIVPHQSIIGCRQAISGRRHYVAWGSSLTKVVPRGHCCHQQKLPASREWKLLLQREFCMCWPPWLLMIYIVRWEKQVSEPWMQYHPFSENKHLCHFYKFLSLSLEKNIGRQILGSLHTSLQEDGSVKGKGFNEIINYFLYICAVLTNYVNISIIHCYI